MGTVWGTYDEFTSFIEELTHELETRASYGRTINDQGSANVILHYNKKFQDILQTSDNADGCVMTIAITNASRIKLDQAGNVLNGKGEVAALVHQYDRHFNVVKAVGYKYSEGMSLYSRLMFRNSENFVGRVMRFITRGRKNGLGVTIAQAIKKRLH